MRYTQDDYDRAEIDALARANARQARATGVLRRARGRPLTAAQRRRYEEASARAAVDLDLARQIARRGRRWRLPGWAWLGLAALLAGVILALVAPVGAAGGARRPGCTEIVWSAAFDHEAGAYPVGCQDGDGYLLTPQSAAPGSDGSPTPGAARQTAIRLRATAGVRYAIRDADGDGYSVRRDGQAVWRDR